MRGKFTIETKAELMKLHDIPRGWWDFFRKRREKKRIKYMREEIMKEIDEKLKKDV